MWGGGPEGETGRGARGDDDGGGGNGTIYTTNKFSKTPRPDPPLLNPPQPRTPPSQTKKRKKRKNQHHPSPSFSSAEASTARDGFPYRGRPWQLVCQQRAQATGPPVFPSFSLSFSPTWPFGRRARMERNSVPLFGLLANPDRRLRRDLSVSCCFFGTAGSGSDLALVELFGRRDGVDSGYGEEGKRGGELSFISFMNVVRTGWAGMPVFTCCDGRGTKYIRIRREHNYHQTSFTKPNQTKDNNMTVNKTPYSLI